VDPRFRGDDERAAGMMAVRGYDSMPKYASH
jgi:hypothetical protein